jgi:IS30 family transposase
MGIKYSQLGLEEREKMALMSAIGLSKREIARELGRSHSTVVRELQRNAAIINKGYYLPSKAHERSKLKRSAAYARQKLKSPAIRAYVESNLSIGWSPEQIAGRISMDLPGSSISHESIYQYVYVHAPYLIGCLARKHKKRYKKGYSRKHQRSHIPNRVTIEERPMLVDKRIRFGHWESDSMVAARSDGGGLNVIVERKSRLVQITKISDLSSLVTRRAITQKLVLLSKHSRRSITYDNGSENVDHEKVNRKLGTKSFFCNPYRSWEKGTVENTIGLIRRFIPKGTEISPIQHRFIRRIEYLLNNRPRKCLGYCTPTEIFIKSGGALAP